MTKLVTRTSEETVLILAPSYNDSAMAVAVLSLVGIKALACKSIDDLCERLKKKYGAVIIAEESLSTEQAPLLQNILEQQKSWSDIPIILLTGSDVVQASKLFTTSGNIALLERPFSQLTLIRAVEVALRARRKQYETRHLMQALKRSKEVAEQASQAKTQFLANMSHEIRTPIGAILGFINLMKNPRNTSDENMNYMHVIERNSQQLLRLIDDILDLSKVEAGKMTIEKIQFNFIDWLIEFNSIMSFKASDKHISFKMHLNVIPDTLITDPLRLRQILFNVVGNAIKFTEKGSVEIFINYEQNKLKFTIKDTGIGISHDQTEKLFQAFSQADPSMTRKFGGTGLGLILSKKLATLLDGDLYLVESEIDQGSTFELITGVELTADTKLSKNPPLQNKSVLNFDQFEQSEKLKGLNVLLVEDSPDNQALIQIYLSKAGVNLKIASNGKQGVEKALKENFDVVLMDIQMPILDGHGATQKLRQKKYGKPIIALTAHAMNEERSRCFASGFTDFLTKPVKKDVLVEVLSRYSPQQSTDQLN